MVIPALAYPATVVATVSPVPVTEKTINNRSPAVTGIDSPDISPLAIAPIDIIPVKLGVRATFPKPTKPTVPANPVNKTVNAVGKPEAKG
ncbi:hypothetical protein [Oceanobacillus kimchii]|uniref:hypothetical protein n=1 Tax=Oceanobacillus kimchii TaxID=746691 RepID=UPI003C7217E0